MQVGPDFDSGASEVWPAFLISDALTCASALRFVCRSHPRVAVALEKHGREQIYVTETTPRSSRSPSRRTCHFCLTAVLMSCRQLCSFPMPLPASARWSFVVCLSSRSYTCAALPSPSFTSSNETSCAGIYVPDAARNKLGSCLIYNHLVLPKRITQRIRDGMFHQRTELTTMIRVPPGYMCLAQRVTISVNL